MLILKHCNLTRDGKKGSFEGSSHLGGHYIIHGDVSSRAAITLGENSSLQIIGNVKSGAMITSEYPGVFVTVLGHVEEGAFIQCHGNITVQSCDSMQSLHPLLGKVIIKTQNQSETAAQPKEGGSSSYSYIFKAPIVATGHSVTHFGPTFN